VKYFNEQNISEINSGYADLITNSQSTLMYASCINNVIYCYSLESAETSILFILFNIISAYTLLLLVLIIIRLFYLSDIHKIDIKIKYIIIIW